MHKMLLGIEHLMTDIQLMEQNPQRPPNSPYHNPAVFKFQQESPSVIRVLCEEPFQAYWPCKQSFLSSVECTPEEEQEYTGPKHQYSQGEAEWWAQRVAPYINGAHAYANTARQSILANHPEQVVNLPYVVLKALRRKYGKYADEVATTLRWDSLNKCWFYTRNGIFFGVEEDGYIHT